MKPVHALYAVVLGVVWFGVLGFVLTHGRNDSSSVNVYTELPPGFTAELQSKGVKYSGLSPVDSGTVQDALAHATLNASATANTATAIVLRTSFSDLGKHPKYVDRPALMVVVPAASSGPSASPSGSAGGSGTVYVDFLDATSLQDLQSVSYTSAG
jgi:hypothetical protein